MNDLDYYVSQKPDILELKRAYDFTVAELEYYFHQCRWSFDDRRRYWNGKASDMRKHGSDAFPWEGASDIEVPLIAEKINAYVALCMAALNRSNIRAYPVESGDSGRAKVVSSFLKWMVNSYIENFKREMEANANYLFEKSIIVTYVGWHQETRSFMQELDLDQISQMSPELAEIIVNGEDDEAVIATLKQVYPALIEKRAKKALKKLRKDGFAQLPVSRKKVDKPIIKAIPADGDVFFPPFTLDPQEAPYIFYRVFMTPQEIRQKVVNNGWDEAWADEVIENYRGVAGLKLQSEYAARQSNPLSRMESGDSDFIEVLYVYQRLIDEEDGSEGIYCTVMHPEYTGDEGEHYAKFELLNGLEDYPFVVTRLSEQNRRLYDVETFSDLLRGLQWQIKVERDSRIDKASITTLPTMRGPAGRPPADLGPGRYIGEKRKGDYDFMPPPQYTVDSVQIEGILLQEADKLVGLEQQPTPLSIVKQQFFIDKYLSHVRDVLKMAWKMFQLYGPDELFFRVTGVSDPMVMRKGSPNEDFDITVSFDSQNADPETQEKKLAQIANLIAFDRNGKFNIDNLIEVAAASIDPVLADAVLQPTEVASQQVIKQVFEDLTSIYSGIERPARPSGAQIALSVLQQYVQQPDIAERLQSDQTFAERLQKYAQQYQFQMQQAQNAQIGRVGTNPATVGQVSTQNMQ